MSSWATSMSLIQYVSEMKLQVIRSPAMSRILARMCFNETGMFLRRAFSMMLSGFFNRELTCSMGL